MDPPPACSPTMKRDRLQCRSEPLLWFSICQRAIRAPVHGKLKRIYEEIIKFFGSIDIQQIMQKVKNHTLSGKQTKMQQEKKQNVHI